MATRKKPFGVQVSEIADELNIPRATVDRVLRKYIENMVSEVQQGNPVAVEGLFSIRCSYAADNSLILRGAVSQTLRSNIAEGEDSKQMRMLKGKVSD